MLLNNEWVNNDIREEIKRHLETNDNEDPATQNIWDRVKAVQREKFIAIHAYLKKQEITQINNITLHLKELEKEQQTKPKVNRKNSKYQSRNK